MCMPRHTILPRADREIVCVNEFNLVCRYCVASEGEHECSLVLKEVAVCRLRPTGVYCMWMR